MAVRGHYTIIAAEMLMKKYIFISHINPVYPVDLGGDPVI